MVRSASGPHWRGSAEARKREERALSGAESAC